MCMTLTTSLANLRLAALSSASVACKETCMSILDQLYCRRKNLLTTSAEDARQTCECLPCPRQQPLQRQPKRCMPPPWPCAQNQTRPATQSSLACMNTGMCSSTGSIQAMQLLGKVALHILHQTILVQRCKHVLAAALTCCPAGT